MKKLTIALSLIALFILSGCVFTEEEQRQLHKKSIDVCIKKGGIPILDKIDATLKECKFLELDF